MMKSNDWFPKGDIILEKEALEVVKDSSNILVVAGPGAGKTELLVQKLDYLFSTNKCIWPRKILALSFKTDAALNLRERVNKRYGAEYSSRFTSLTYSAFEKRMLDQFRNALPEKMRPCKKYFIEDWEIIKDVLSKNEINVHNSNLSRIQRYVEKIILEDNKENNIRNLLLKGSESNNAVLLYKQITKLATHILANNEYIRKSLQMTYEYIFLDEFQDTTHHQYNLLKTCFLDSCCKLTAVGDDRQAIMRWAGANPNIFYDFIKDFDSKEYKLSMNYRSVPKLVEFQKRVCQILNSNYDTITKIDNHNFADGEIVLYEFENEHVEAEVIANDIESKIQDGIPLSEICILVKQKVYYYSEELMYKLRVRDIPVRVEQEYQELLNDPICNFLLELILCSQGKKNPLIWKNINNFYENIYGIYDFNDETSIEKYYMRLNKLVNNIANLISKSVCSEEQMLILIDKIIEEIGEEKIVSNYLIYNGSKDIAAIIKRFSKLLYKEYNQIQGDWIKTVSNFKGENSISIMTIHKSKGLEFEVVYFLGLEDSAFWNINNQQEEDKNTFFVGVSRAKSNLIFTNCNYRKKIKQDKNNIKEIYSILCQENFVLKKSI